MKRKLNEHVVEVTIVSFTAWLMHKKKSDVSKKFKSFYRL